MGEQQHGTQGAELAAGQLQRRRQADQRRDGAVDPHERARHPYHAGLGGQIQQTHGRSERLAQDIDPAPRLRCLDGDHDRQHDLDQS